MDEMQETVETLIDLDEPEALLSTLQSIAQRHKGERWQRLASALKQAELDLLTNPTPTNFQPPSEEGYAMQEAANLKARQTAGQAPPDSEAKPE